MDTQELFKEIDLIQNSINRMAKYSFMIKGWALTIFAGVLVIGKVDLQDNLLLFLCAVLVPYLVFWILDATFLQTERKYRKMYAWVLKERKKGNMDYQYDLNPSRFDEVVGPLLCSLFSKTLVLFYGIPILGATIFAIVQLF